MLRLPVLEGIIKRRLLVNFRADPATVQRILPEGFRPKLHDGHAIAGICLIRLEEIRPKGMPAAIGLRSENAAHRMAVEWTDADGSAREGVFIPRRDTDSTLSALAGGRVFPGEHHHAAFTVADDGMSIAVAFTSRDGTASVSVRGRAGAALPAGSCFATFAQASRFFENGCVGYSATRDASRLDGIELRTAAWHVEPFHVEEARSSFFEDESRFPRGSVEFDHCLLMRDIPHEWRAAPDLHAGMPDDGARAQSSPSSPIDSVGQPSRAS